MGDISHLRLVGAALRRFRRRNDGAALVEFAFTAPLFLVALFSLFELGLLGVRIASLDNAAVLASRFIYTGQAAAGTVTREDIVDVICDNVYMVSDCASNLVLEAQPIPSINNPPTTDAPCTATGGALAPAAVFRTGNEKEVMYMRVCLTADLALPYFGLGSTIQKTADGRVQLISSLAFVNEPYGAGGSTP